MDSDSNIKEAVDRIEYYLSAENIHKDSVLASYLNQDDDSCNNKIIK